MSGISVIIATVNRSSDLRAALGSIAAQSLLPDEIIIVDQSEDDITLKETGIFKKGAGAAIPRIEYFKIPEKSLVKARNIGLEKARGDIMVFLDDDVVLSRDYMQNAAKFLSSHKNAAGVGGRVINIHRPRGLKWFIRANLMQIFLLNMFNGRMTVSGFGYPIFDDGFNKTTQVDMLAGCNMCFKRGCINGNRFDEWFSGYSYREDADFSYSVSRKAGLFIIPEATLRHNYSQEGRLDKFSLWPMQLRNYYYVFKKYKSKTPFSVILFFYSLLGYFLIDLLEFAGSPRVEDLRKIGVNFLTVFKYIAGRGI